MSVEYDLVVIGKSEAGIYAALTATRLGARVALVEQGISAHPLQNQALFQWGQRIKNQARQPQGSSLPAIDPGQQWQNALTWVREMMVTLDTDSATAVMASAGVEIVPGCGQFSRKPHLSFQLDTRRLRAKNYLIAMGGCPLIPEIDGLETVGYLTTASPWTQQSTLPHRLMVLGGDPTGVALAQTLARLGVAVTIAVRGRHILAKDDPEAAYLIQSQLEAEGVRILTQTEVSQVRQIGEQKWLQAASQAIEVDEILVAAGQRSQVTDLNLEAVGVKVDRRGIQLNDNLQTTHPRIYACGDPIAGYASPHLSRYQAEIAVANLLFLPTFKVDYWGMPWVTPTEPELVRLGMTEPQALQAHGKEVLVLRQTTHASIAAQLRGEEVGLCKLIVRSSGEILGVHLVGNGVSELASVVTLAMRQGLKVDALADLPVLSPTISQLVSTTASQWYWHSFDRHPIQKNLLQAFFSWRRSWFS